MSVYIGIELSITDPFLSYLVANVVPSELYNSTFTFCIFFSASPVSLSMPCFPSPIRPSSVKTSFVSTHTVPASVVSSSKHNTNDGAISSSSS